MESEVKGMSQTVFDEKDFIKRVPKKVLERTKENMEVYNMDLTDSFQEATRELAKEGTTLWKAWYYDDFREYVPCIYEPKYLDFSKYPLKYKDKQNARKTEPSRKNRVVAIYNKNSRGNFKMEKRIRKILPSKCTKNPAIQFN